MKNMNRGGSWGQGQTFVFILTKTVINNNTKWFASRKDKKTRSFG